MKNVLLIDSGSGGINILKECVHVCPYCNYLLFCDALNLPYGNKSKEELIDITKKNLNRIYSFFKFEIVILACNTLTATVIDEMREKYKNVIFVGTVPAIKPALIDFKEEDILVLATESTIKNNKLIKKHKNVRCLALNDLAPLIDENLDNLDILEPYLEDKIKGDFKAIVLGCTHYVAISKLLKKILPNITLYDSANGVARRLKSYLNYEKEEFQVQLFCDKTENLGKFWYYYFNT